jgi:beta-lactamase regulating signal transducer with metallopeptidase domain
MTAFADAAEIAILHSVWQETALAVALWLVLGLMRRARADARYLVACGALAAMLLLPLATLAASLGDAGQRQWPAIAPVWQSGSPFVTADGSRIWTDRALDPDTMLVFVQGWIVPVWLAGVVIASLRLVRATNYVRAVRRNGVPATADVAATVAGLATGAGVVRRIDLIVTTMVESPATVGWLRPVILLPPALVAGLSRAQLEAILAHEIAHIRRNDFLVNVAQMVAETLLFYHPAVWWASRQLRVERELCCDDFAVQTSGDPREYANALAAVARHRLTGATLSVAGPSLPGRVRRLLLGSDDSARPGVGSVAAALLVLGVAVGTATWVQAQTRLAAQTGNLVTLSLRVFDPLGRPAANVPLVFEQGAFQEGDLFGHGFTDRGGRYTVALPAGTYSFSALIDFFPPTAITLKSGRVERDVQMHLEPMSGAFTVCIDCGDGITPLSPSVAQDFQRDRDDYATVLTRTAEPVGGWDQFRLDVPASLRQRDRSVLGNVTVAGRAGIDGRLTNLRVVSSAHPALSDAALAALAAQRWVPARVGLTAVEVDVLIELDYVRNREE